MWLAWHAGAFAGAAFNGALKPLAEYRGGEKGGRQSSAEMLGSLRMLQDMGAPMTIRQAN